MDRSKQESEKELLDPMSEHSTAIWDQQGRPIEGIIVPKSGHVTAYVECLGPFAFRIGEKNSVWCIPFWCKVYVHCIHCVYGYSGVLYFCTLC